MIEQVPGFYYKPKVMFRPIADRKHPIPARKGGKRLKRRKMQAPADSVSRKGQSKTDILDNFKKLAPKCVLSEQAITTITPFMFNPKEMS